MFDVTSSCANIMISDVQWNVDVRTKQLRENICIISARHDSAVFFGQLRRHRYQPSTPPSRVGGAYIFSEMAPTPFFSEICHPSQPFPPLTAISGNKVL